MTPKQIRLVQNTWHQLEPILEDASALFYGRLFELDPTARRLFKGDMAEQGQKLMHMLNVAVTGLRKLDLIVPAVEELGRRHLKYQVTEEMYDTVGAALLWTIGQGLGPAFTDEVEEAWTETYNTLADLMKSAAYSHA